MVGVQRRYESEITSFVRNRLRKNRSKKSIVLRRVLHYCTFCCKNKSGTTSKFVISVWTAAEMAPVCALIHRSCLAILLRVLILKPYLIRMKGIGMKRTDRKASKLLAQPTPSLL